MTGGAAITIVKDFESLIGGEPSSVTFTVIRLVLGPCVSVGVQVSTPLLGSRFTPVGADTKLKVNVFAGRSASLAVFVTVSVLSSVMVRSGGTVSTGARFTSLTITVKLLVALNGGTPLSVTTVAIVPMLGPCVSLGVQRITPPVSMLAPDGGAINR